jgi:hypothetical protein
MTQRLTLLLCEFANNPVLFVGPRIDPVPGRRGYDFLAGRNEVAKPYTNCVDRTMLKAVDIAELC